MFPLLVQGGAWCKGVMFVCAMLVQSNLTPLHQKGELRWNSSCLAALRAKQELFHRNLFEHVFGWCLLVAWVLVGAGSVIIA